MQITAQAYPIPKAGGTFWFRLLSDDGIPLTFNSVTCSTSSINSSITYDKPNFIFWATFPANTSTSNKSYKFTVSYYINGDSRTDEFDIAQTGTSNYLYTADSNLVITPFVASARSEFYSSADPSNYGLNHTYVSNDSTFTAPHFASVSEYYAAAHNGELEDNQWVFVDGKYNTADSCSFNTYRLKSFMWIDEDAVETSTTTPCIYLNYLCNTGGTRYSSKPSNDVLKTYRTVGFKHPHSANTSTNAYNNTIGQFVQATDTGWWTNTTVYNPSGTTISVTRPHILYYYLPSSDVTYSSLGNNKYSSSRNFTIQTTPRTIIRSINIDGDFTCEKVFLQVPENSVSITETTTTKNSTAGSQSLNVGTFKNFSYDNSLFSVSFPNGQPEWITSATITNPSSNDLRLTYDCTENDTGSSRSTTARINWLDKYDDITITQKSGSGSITAAYNPAIIKAQATNYYDVLTLNNVDSSTLSVSNSTAHFETTIANYNGSKCLKITAFKANLCLDSTITDTAVITGIDSNGDTVTLNVQIQQLTEDSDIYYTPNTSSGESGEYYEINTAGETIDFTINNVTCSGATNPGYHITGMRRVYYMLSGGSTQVDLSYTTSFVDGILHCYVTFPAYSSESGLDSNYAYLYFVPTDDFVPGDRAIDSSAGFKFKQAAPPAGTISFNADDPVWVNAVSSTSDSTTSIFNKNLSFTTTNVDKETLSCSGYDTNMIDHINFNTTKTSIFVYFNPNTSNTQRNTSITLSGTDTNGNTVSDTITINQVSYDDRIAIKITSPTGTTSSNPAIIENDTLTVLFTAINLGSFTLTGTMKSYVTNSTFTNISGNDWQAVLTFSDNEGTVRNGYFSIVGTNTISGSPLSSTVTSTNIRVRQTVPDGSLSIDRNSIIVPANSNYQHQDVRVTYSNINGSVTPTISGDVTGTFEWYDYNNNHYLLFNPNNNTTENTLTGTVTLTAVDYNGNNLTASYTVTQKPYNPSLIYQGTELAILRIKYDETSRAIPIVCKGISNISGISLYDPDPSGVYSFTSFFTSGSLEKIDDNNYTYTIKTRYNNARIKSDSGYLEASVTTEFGKNPWVDSYNISGGYPRQRIVKYGIPGTLSISPTSKTVDGNAGSTSFTIYKDSYLTGTLSTDHSGDMNITNVSISSTSSGNTLNVSYGANNSDIDKYETITVSGTDYQGLTVTSTATLRQNVIYNISFVDTQKAIAQDATTVSFEINDKNVTNLKASNSGSVVVTKSAFISTSTGHILTLTVSPNDTRVSRSSTITVTASNPYGTTLTTSARLTQAGLDGLLTIDPTNRTVPKTGSSFDITVSTDGIVPETITASTSGNINFGTLRWNGDKTLLTVYYNTNEGSVDLTGSVIVSGTDYNGNTQSATCNVTQVTADSSLTITPNEQTVDTTESTTTTFTINNTYVTLGNVSFSGDTSYVNSYNLQGNTLTLNLRKVTVAAEFIVYVTISGYDLGGSEISDTATLKVWGLDGYFNLTPSTGWFKNKDAGTVYFSLSTFGIQSNSVTKVVDQAWASVSSDSIRYNAYSGVPTTWDTHRDCTLTISGVDYKGNVITETRVLRQYALDADLTINPTTASIEYDGYVDVEVTLVGAMPIPDISGDGTKVWLNEWGEETIRTNTVRITPPVNQQYKEKTLQYGIGGQPLYDGGSIARYLTITQAAKPATIVLTPATSTVTKEAGSIVFDITVDGVTQSSLNRTWSATHSGMITSATFNSDKTQLTVVYTANTLVANRVGTISVYSDSLGTRVTGKAVITQTGVDPVLSAYDLAIGYHQATATNFITTKGVGNLSVSFSGDVTISNYELTSASGGYNLVITTPNNDTTTTYTSVATVTGTVTEGQYEGQTRTATFNIYKYGIESVTLTPSSRLLEYGQNTTTYTVNAINVNNLQVSVSGDSSFITNRTLSNGTLTITTADFAAKTAKNATITVSGTGFTGTISGSATLTKYGPDGTITASTNALAFPRSAYSKNVTVTIEGITGSVTPTYTGTISPSNISLSGSTLTVALNANTTSGDLTGTITLTGTDYKGKTITETISVVQKPYDSLIQLDPSSKTVDKSAGSTTYTLITDSVDLSTLKVSYSGPSITNATRNGDTITVTYRENTVVATRNNTVTVTATDIYGTSVSATSDLFQTGIDPTISANNINILSTQANATAFVATNGIGLPATVSFSGNVNITDYSVSSTSGGLNVNIVTADNLTNSPLTSTATITATVTEGQYTGETRTATFNVTKFGLEGIITIDPDTLTVKKAGQIVVFDVSLGNMQNNTVTASTGTFNQDKSKLTVTVGQNTSSSDRTINVVVSGTDNNGNTKSATAVINQYGIDPYIAINPSSRTLRYDVSNTSYGVTAYKVSDLSVNIEGGVTVVNYDLTGSTLSITTADNEERFSVMSIITVTGTSETGETVTATATLSKFGKGGGILVDTDYTIPSNAGTLVIPYDVDQVDPDSIVAIAEGDIEITKVYVNREDEVIVIDYGANNANSSISGRITVTGVGDDELPKYSIIDLTQLGNDVKLTINPAHNTVSYTATSSSATVTATGVSRTNMNYSGSIEPSSCTFNKNSSEGGTINASFPANSTNARKFLYTTITGYDYAGTTVTSSAIVEQGSDPSTGPYVFMLQPASQVIKVIEASANNVYYSVYSYKGNASVGYNITGFVLTGKWGAKPSVAYSNGYPYVKVPLNTHPEERETLAVFVQDGSYNTLTARIIQQEGVEPDVTPIWKEFVNSDTADSFIEYHINLDGDIIYAGKAYKYPDSSKITWSINDAVSNYLGNGIQFTEGIHQIPNYAKDFYMETNTDKKYIETFYNSWAYKDTDYWLSDPIDYRVDQRQWLPVSFLSTNYNQITINGRVYAALKENDGWTVMTKLGKYIVDCDAGISVIGADGNRLNYKIASGDYVLYYSNAYGGWDSLLCNGTSRKTDNIEHLNYRRKSVNQSQFSKINYQNNITPTWSLNTGINVDGSKMYHLLESTMVYLHNLETNEIIPVVITNSSCDYLNYTNNGKKPYYYTITVEESNQKLRK